MSLTTLLETDSCNAGRLEPRHNVRKSTDTHMRLPYDVSISQKLVGGDHVWIRTTRHTIGHRFDSLDYSKSVRKLVDGQSEPK